MGRSINSFSQGMGHALEINDDRITLPEKDLWVAVLAFLRSPARFSSGLAGS